MSELEAFSRISGDQDGLHVFARVHFFKAFEPLRQRSNAADDGIEIDLTRHDHRDHAFPNRPIMGETAGESDVLLDEGIEAELHRLRSPTDFDDLPGGPDRLHGCLQGHGDSGGVDHDVYAQSVSQLGNIVENVAVKRESAPMARAAYQP